MARVSLYIKEGRSINRIRRDFVCTVQRDDREFRRNIVGPGQRLYIKEPHISIFSGTFNVYGTSIVDRGFRSFRVCPGLIRPSNGPIEITVI